MEKLIALKYEWRVLIDFRENQGIFDITTRKVGIRVAQLINSAKRAKEGACSSGPAWSARSISFFPNPLRELSTA